jgi:hypothetical protein
MPRVLSFKQYEIYIYRELGGKHHSPHCHVRFSGEESILSIPMLNVIVGKELPRDINMFLLENLSELCAAWDELNPTSNKNGKTNE